MATDIHARRPTEAQQRRLCEMMHRAFVLIRAFGGEGEARRAADLADAFENLPIEMWRDDFSLRDHRDVFFAPYEAKHGVRWESFVEMIDEIIAMTPP